MCSLWTGGLALLAGLRVAEFQRPASRRAAQLLSARPSFHVGLGMFSQTLANKVQLKPVSWK